MEIIKRPIVEDDTMFLTFNKVDIENLRKVLDEDDYYLTKSLMFQNKSLDSRQLREFSENRPSLRNMPKYMEGSIYTYTVEKKNGLSYENMMYRVRHMLSINSRRAVVVVADRFLDYYISQKTQEQNLMDVSCLSTIHYKKDEITLFFRASDIKNEFVVDVLTIYNNFARPVYGERDLKINFIASSCQNIESFDEEIEKFR